jgi:Ca2+-transporting ATPase
MDRSLRDGLMAEADGMAAEGLRVIGFAGRRMDPGEPISMDGAESGLTFLGMAGLEDPPRPEAAAAVASLKSAGVRVLMLTGDHPATARAG